MKSSDITVAQAKEMHERMLEVHREVRDLKERLQKLGFPADDVYFIRVARAENAMHDLLIHTMYMTVPYGVGVAERDVGDELITPENATSSPATGDYSDTRDVAEVEDWGER